MAPEKVSSKPATPAKTVPDNDTSEAIPYTNVACVSDDEYENNYQIITDQDGARGSWHSTEKRIRTDFIALHVYLSIMSRRFTRGLGGANMNLQMSEWAYGDFSRIIH